MFVIVLLLLTSNVCWEIFGHVAAHLCNLAHVVTKEIFKKIF